MIPRAAIVAWREQAPWGADSQIEQDLVISRALVEIFSDDDLRAELAFRGGTALHKLYFHPPERYSEDIDLVRTTAGPVKSIVRRLRARLEPWLGDAKYKSSRHSVRLIFRFDGTGEPPVSIRLKVETNVRETFSVDDRQQHLFSVNSPWFSGSASITTFSLPELLGTKLRALYQRSKGRDAFDLDRALQLPKPPEAERIVEIFKRYVDAGGDSISCAQFLKNLEEKRRDIDFLADIHPLLSAEAARYDPLEGLQRIETLLLARI